MKKFFTDYKVRSLIRKDLLIVFIMFAVSVIVRFLLADRYPIKLECYSDEIRYYSIASSIADGNGITLYNGPTDYQKILYSVCIAPAFLFNTLEVRFSGIFFINSVLMSAGVFAVYYLTYKLIRDSKLRYIVCCMYLLLAHMVYTMTFMSENLWIPLALTLMCMFYRLLIEPFKAKEQVYGFNILLGIVTYFGYLTKEIALVFLIAYAGYLFIECSFNKDIKKNDIVIWIKGYVIYLVFFLLPYMITKVTIFSGLGNSYNQMGITALFGVDKIYYLFYGFTFFIVGFMVMTLELPVLLPAIYYDKLEPNAKKMMTFLSLLLLTAAFVVSYTITLREDYPSLTPRLHMRYVAWMMIPFLIILINFFENSIQDSNLIRNLRVAVVFVIEILIVVVFKGLKVSAFDNTMRMAENVNTNTLFLMLIVLAILSVIAVLAVQNKKQNKKYVVLAMFLLTMSMVQIYDNLYAVHTFKTAYSISEQEEQEAMILYDFVKQHKNETILYVEEWLTRECKIMDTYLAEPNVITTTGKNLCSRQNNNNLNLGDINIPMAWYGEYDKQDVDYIIINNNYKVIEAFNCLKLDNICTKNYNVYQIVDSMKPVSIYEAYIENNEAISFSGDTWNADAYVTSGISSNENDFTWTDGNEVQFKRIKIQDCKEKKDYVMNLQVHNVYAKSQDIQIISNGELVYDAELTGEGILHIPVSTDAEGYLNLSILLPNAISPVEYEGLADERKLALALGSITFTLVE